MGTLSVWRSLSQQLGQNTQCMARGSSGINLTRNEMPSICSLRELQMAMGVGVDKDVA